MNLNIKKSMKLCYFDHCVESALGPSDTLRQVYCSTDMFDPTIFATSYEDLDCEAGCNAVQGVCNAVPQAMDIS